MLTVKRLSSDDARTMVAAAEAKAREIGVPMCVAVVDESGTLIAFSRMDGAKVLSVGLAQDKAFTAAIARRPTHFYNEKAVPGSLLYGIHTAGGGRFSLVAGGFPVFAGDDVVGGIGASSGTPEEDMAVAEAGAEAFKA
jgi:uncharacterized protein GlcG (DUF336 family)